MPKKSKPSGLGAAEKRRLARRRAELQAKRKRSVAAAKGWDTRRKNASARAVVQAAVKHVEIQPVKEVRKKVKEARKKFTSKQVDRMIEKAVEKGRELGKQELLTEVWEHHFRQETPDGRKLRMIQQWREIDALGARRSRSRYLDLLNWVQRNGFVDVEFWAEYRRRKGR